MCFSSTASFTSGIVLMASSVVCLNEVIRKRCARYIPLALTPLFFGTQQISEGFVWHGINTHNVQMAVFASLIFLFFALFFWITWLPFVAYKLEKKLRLKQFFLFLMIAGFCYGVYLWLPGVLESRTNPEIAPYVQAHHLVYNWYEHALNPWVRDGLYASIGFLLLLSSNSIFRRYWFVVMIAAIITRVTSAYAWTSVWCFFAALATLYVWYLLHYSDKKTLKQ